MKIKYIQQAFFNAIVQHEPICLDIFKFENHCHIKERLAIYRDAYYLRLKNSLQQDFSVLAEILGEALFNDLCLKYIQRYPSLEPSLSFYGKHFPNFLRELNIEPVFIALAQFEWALVEVFYEADDALLIVEDLQELGTDKIPLIPLQLIRAARIVKLDTNCLNIFASKLVDHSQKLNPTTILIWRQDNEIKFRELKFPEDQLLATIIAPIKFSDLAEQAGNFILEDAAEKIAAYLLGWIKEGLIYKGNIES